VQLTPHFHLDEFRCPCCNDVILDAARALAKRLEPVREAYGPIFLLSSYRCQRHNYDEGGALFSQHLIGLAADINCPGDADRFSLLKALIDSGFTRIGIASRSIHADIGNQTGPVIWTYY